MGKKLLIVILAVALMCQVVTVDAAMAVYDASAVAKLAEELQQWQQQMKYWQQQLATIDGSNTAAINSQISSYRTLQNKLSYLLTDYNDMADYWDNLYQDYSTWGADQKTADNYIGDIQAVADAMKLAQREATVAQSLSAETYEDLDMLTTLLQSSQNATGTVQAQQVANQIAALQVKQLVRLQQMIAEYNKVQLLNMRDQKQNEAQTQGVINNKMETVTPDSSKGNVDVRGGKTTTDDDEE